MCTCHELHPLNFNSNFLHAINILFVFIYHFLLTCNQSAIRSSQKTAKKRSWRDLTFGSFFCYSFQCMAA